MPNSKREWDDIWEKRLKEYIDVVPRTGIYIKSIFKNKISKILEIGSGSCRDSKYLVENRYYVVCGDFSFKTLENVKKLFSVDNLSYVVADAFNLPFKDEHFDLVFHNGLFIYFNKNDDIIYLLKEQYRISRKYLVFFVHNKMNIYLVNNFCQKAKYDSLYNIRFFNMEEIYEIINDSKIKYKKLCFKKFGGKFDILYSKKLKSFIRYFQHVVPNLYVFQKWNKTERICTIIELDK